MDSASTVYQSIGDLWQKEKEHQKSINNYKKAITIELKAYKPNYAYLIELYSAVGFVLKNNKRYKESMTFFEKALDSHRKTNKADIDIKEHLEQQLKEVRKYVSDIQSQL